ncbi:Yip1 family protein [Domibacillus indicus]|uniref:Yip1 family protein n=1 Tax=Domibacillus indicus TaxID=1437523 RepID=UPI000617E146|nr:Yip1 family protein [Domibacillus indicus]
MSEETSNTAHSKPSLFAFITSPVQQFERMKHRPAIWGPGLIVLILFAAAASLSGLLPETLKVTADAVGVSTEQARTISLISTGGMSLFIFPITVLISAGITYLIVKIAGGTAAFKHLITFTIFILFITTIGQIVNYGVALAAGTDPNVTSLNGLIGLDGKLGGALSAFEIFTIWSVILTGIGLPIVTSISRRAGWIIAGILFLLTLLMGIFSGAVY